MFSKPPSIGAYLTFLFPVLQEKGKQATCYTALQYRFARRGEAETEISVTGICRSDGLSVGWIVCWKVCWLLNIWITTSQACSLNRRHQSHFKFISSFIHHSFIHEQCSSIITFILTPKERIIGLLSLVTLKDSSVRDKSTDLIYNLKS